MKGLKLSKWEWAATVLVLGVHAWVLVSALLRQSWLIDDSVQYLSLAENLSQNGIFSQNFYPPFVADVQRVPGYPVFLMLFKNPAIILILQHLMVLGTGYYLFRGMKPHFGEKPAKIAAWLWLLQPYPILFASLILSESLFIFLFVAGFSMWMEPLSNRKPAFLIAGFVVMTLSAYVRPLTFVIIPLLAGISAIVLLRKSGWKGLRLALALILLPISVMMPWMARNHSISGKWTMSSMSDLGMWYGRAAGLEAQKTGIQPTDAVLFATGDSLAAAEYGLGNIKSWPKGREMQETESLNFGATGKTVKRFLNSPGEAIIFQAKSTFQMLKGVGLGWADKVVGRPGAYLLAGLQGLMNFLMFGSVTFALIKIRSWKPPLWWAISIIMMIFLLSAAVWSDGRYRVPADAFMMVFVAFALMKIRKPGN